MLMSKESDRDLYFHHFKHNLINMSKVSHPLSIHCFITQASAWFLWLKVCIFTPNS